MAEILEEQDSARPEFDRYVDILRRRHMHLLIPVLLGWLFVWGLTFVLETKYKSSTLILVEQPTMPENYVAPNVNENLQDRLQTITQQILSRTRLLLIIDKLGLYGGPNSATTADQKVKLMQKDIDIELVRDQRNFQITSFRISYSAHDPHVAQQVTTELTALFINENNRVRQEQSQGTTKFIEDQLEGARVALSAQEAKVREFEAAHEGVLPSQQTANLQILNGLQEQLQNEQNSLDTARQQRVYFQTLIEQYKDLHAATLNGDGVPADLPAIDAELNRLNAQLTDLSSHYTDRYPDVLKLKAQIAKTEQLRDEVLSGSRTAKTPVRAAGPSQNPALLQLQSQLQANQTEIANRERGIAAQQGRIAEYQGRLNGAPATEQQLAELTRGYDQSKANYDDLLKKKNNSVMATSMEALQQGERFTILDPPTLPAVPDFPNRLKFSGIGLAVGLALGIFVVAAFEFLDDRLHDETEIRDILPMSVLSEIPEIKSPMDERADKRRIVFGWATAVIVLAVIVSGSAFSFLHG
jgi:polysaccharide biosynthesis transport protein